MVSRAQDMARRTSPGTRAPTSGSSSFVVASFALGCTLGALGVARFGFVVLVVPTAVTLFSRSQVHDRPA
jgi:hypothetical protein